MSLSERHVFLQTAEGPDADAFCVQADCRDGAGSVPDHRNKASISTEQIIIFLLVESLAFHLLKKATSVRSNKMERNKTRCVHGSGLQRNGMRASPRKALSNGLQRRR